MKKATIYRHGDQRKLTVIIDEKSVEIIIKMIFGQQIVFSIKDQPGKHYSFIGKEMKELDPDNMIIDGTPSILTVCYTDKNGHNAQKDVVFNITSAGFFIFSKVANGKAFILNGDSRLVLDSPNSVFKGRTIDAEDSVLLENDVETLMSFSMISGKSYASRNRVNKFSEHRKRED